MKKFLRENGLSIVLFLLFAVSLVGHMLSGYFVFNAEQGEHGEALVSFLSYLATGHFWETLTENWESEFLQMGFYVYLTVFLFQKGSSESKDPDSPEAEVDADPFKISAREAAKAPWPVRKKGWVLHLYQNSLSLAFLLLFLISFLLHADAGARHFSEQQAAHGEPAVSLGQYLVSSQFWFESFQNWQSEFLAVFAMVVLSIWLRQRGSPESKPVHSPHSQTGD